MNERIKELAEQANAWYPNGYPSAEGGDAAWKNLVIFEKEDLQKFAELIIRECFKAAMIESKGHMNPIDLMAHMKERVGVEEQRGWVCPKCGTDRTKAACPKGNTAAVTGDCPMYGVAQ